MARRSLEIPASAAVLVVAGYALWPPGRVYWTALGDVIGETPTVAVVTLGAALVGVAIAAASDVALPNLAAGGGVAYAGGIALIESTRTPDSPVHVLLYAWLLGWILAGAVAWRYGREGGRSTAGS